MALIEVIEVNTNWDRSVLENPNRIALSEAISESEIEPTLLLLIDLAVLTNTASWSDEKAFDASPNNVWHEVNSVFVNVDNWLAVKEFNEPAKLFKSSHVITTVPLLI